MEEKHEITFETAYQRRMKNYHVENTFYLRVIGGNKEYPDEIKRYDKLILMGIFDHKTGNKMEWAYSFGDQEAMWEEVIKTFVLQSKRKRVIKRWEEFIEEIMSAGSINR